MDAFEVKSIRDFERYLPTAYVRYATKSWHDREVSALVAAATKSDLDEGTHRVWRHRRYKELALPLDFVWQIAEVLESAHYPPPEE